jgi:hypothetical protein
VSTRRLRNGTLQLRSTPGARAILGPDGKPRPDKFAFHGANGTARKMIGPEGREVYGIDRRIFEAKARKAAARGLAAAGVPAGAMQGALPDTIAQVVARRLAVAAQKRAAAAAAEG